MATAGKSPRLPVRQPHGRSEGRFEHKPRLLKTAERIRAVGTGTWTKGAERAAADIQRGLATETEKIHREKLPNGKMGRYSAERTALHGRIIQALLQGHPSHIGSAQAHFMAGGPASGKSSLIDRGRVKLPKDAVHINPDTIKEMLPEYRALNKAGYKDAAFAAHEESSHIAALATNIALGQRMHVVVDTVGNSEPGKFARKIRNAQAAGHKVSIHYATLPTETAVARNEARSRTVPEPFLRVAHQSVVERYHGEIQHLPGTSIEIHDNTGRRPKLVARARVRRGHGHGDTAGHQRLLPEGERGGEHDMTTQTARTPQQFDCYIGEVEGGYEVAAHGRVIDTVPDLAQARVLLGEHCADRPRWLVTKSGSYVELS